MRGNTLGAVNAAKTHCAQGHAFDASNTRYGKQRKCRTCATEESRRARMDPDRRAKIQEHAYKRRQRGLPPDDPRHGTTNGYGNLGCRCAPCAEANSRACARRHLRRRRAQ